MAERQALLALAANIVSAHVSNNAVALDQLPELIRQVLNALTTVEQATAAPTKPEPAVPVEDRSFPITSSVSIAASNFPCCGGI